MQEGVGLLFTNVMPIFMIIALDIVITMRFSINCSTVICLPTICILPREKPLVKTMAPGSIFYHIIFRSTKPKTQKYLDAIYSYLFIWHSIYQSTTNLSHVCLPILRRRTQKGLTTPLTRRVARFLFVCAGTRCFAYSLLLD